MANSDFGIAISQDGVPVATAADYQKVLDSRWKFLEVLTEFDYDVQLDAIPMGSLQYVDTFIQTHGLNDFPAFEASLTTSSTDPGFPYSNGYPELRADKSALYFRRTRVPSEDAPAVRVTGRIRVYNLAILQDYNAPRELTSLESGPESEYGFRSLDGSVPNLGPSDQAHVGYSIDTKKKILSVHRTGLVEIGGGFHTGSATTVNTATDTFTWADNSGTPLKPGGDGTDWMVTGLGLTYYTFGTYPSPLVFNTPYYVIKVSNTEFKLATTPANAAAGIAIDITSVGSLPGFLSAVYDGVAASTIKHDVGYPPTFLIAPIDDTVVIPTIGPLMDTILAHITATNTTLKFQGIQSVFQGRFGLIILKDPAEIAS